MIVSLWKAGIDVHGIDVKTDDRCGHGNDHWVSEISKSQSTKRPGKFVIIGGPSHFGGVSGVGVNVRLGISSLDFEVGRRGVRPTAEIDTRTFQGRPKQDFHITLPSRR